MSDPANAFAAVPATGQTGQPARPVTVGFLSIVTDAAGVTGGYLLTNGWGRPLEFRLSSAVLPTRVQQILYGATLTEFLHADLIGKTLIEKTAGLPTLVVTDTLEALAVGEHLGVPAVSVARADGFGTRPFPTAKCSVPLSFRPSGVSAEQLEALLDRLDATVDLAEPFARVREAMAEARKSGGVSRAA